MCVFMCVCVFFWNLYANILSCLSCVCVCLNFYNITNTTTCYNWFVCHNVCLFVCHNVCLSVCLALNQSRQSYFVLHPLQTYSLWIVNIVVEFMFLSEINIEIFKLENILLFNLVLNVNFWTWSVIPHHVFLCIFKNFCHAYSRLGLVKLRLRIRITSGPQG